MTIIRQFPPRITPEPPTEPPNAQNGGRVQSITVKPTNNDHIIVANQLGGLWKTSNRGLNWEHIDGLAPIFIKDVQYAPDGNTVIATAARDNRFGGGIWVSRDGGSSWFRPPTGDPHNDPNLPNLSRIPDIISTYGICYSPSDHDTVYVGTDYGVAVSTNNGDTWNHKMLDDTQPIWTDSYNFPRPKMQNSVTSIIALPNHTVIAICGMGIYRTDDPLSVNWRWRNLSRPGNFAFEWNYGCKKIDVSPFDTDKVFILQDYTNLLLYEVSLNQFHDIPLPGGLMRGPFVRVARSFDGTSFDLWIGAGIALLKATCSDINSAKNLRASDWFPMSWGNGIHPDTGYLALDNNKRPLLYGSDGGLYRPTNEEGTKWRGIDTGETGTNSFQISDLAGTNVRMRSGAYRTSLYFATQDNDIWASPNGGYSWPNHDSSEGCRIQVQQDANDGELVQVAYVRIVDCNDPDPEVCREENRRFSGANLVNPGPGPVPNRDITGMQLGGFSEPFFVSPNNWVRYRSDREIYISTNNGANWRKRLEVRLQQIGLPAISGSPDNPVIYFPFKARRIINNNVREIIFLLKVQDLFNLQVDRPGVTYVYLPDNGSLGVRATEFDYHAVYGVDPQNPDYIILPDIYHQRVMFSRSSTRGRPNWGRDDILTNRVTENGNSLMYGGDHLVQITKISFDPYNPNRILVGTLDLGIIISEDRGVTWTSIRGSRVISYITNFFFRRDNVVIVSSYGRGLWILDFRWFLEPFPNEIYCKNRDCIIRDPILSKMLEHPDWSDKDVIIFFNGQINGLTLSGHEVKALTLTPGTVFERYVGKTKKSNELYITESEKGEGFTGLLGCMAALKNGEIIKGIILKENEIIGVISGKEQFKHEDKNSPPVVTQNISGEESTETASDPESTEPYLFVSTNIPISGEPVVGRDNIIHLFGTGFNFDSGAGYVSIMLDGQLIEKNLKVGQNGNVKAELRLSNMLSDGKHIIKMVQNLQEYEIVAIGSIVKTTIDDFGDEDKK